MKRFTFLLSLILLTLCLAVSVFATDKTVFVAAGGTGDGASAAAPIGSIADAYAVLGDEGGTLVFMNKYSLSARIDLPKHSGKITWTNVYNGIDYRESGAMLYWAGSYRIGFGGPTEIDNFVFTDASDAGGVLAANFHDLTIGEDVQTLNTSGATESKILVLGGPNIDTSVAALASGKSSTLTLQSGSYGSVIAFSRAVAKSHEGTVTVNLSGSTVAKNCCLGADGNNAKGGTAILNLSDSAHIDTLNLSNNPAAAMNGTVTVNITDTASIDTLTNTASALYYEATASLPSTFADHFDTATQIEIPTGKVVFVSMGASGTGESADSPVGTLAAAYAVLGDEGGTVVLIGETTLPINMTWKINGTHASFQEPMHTGKVLVTSVYDGADYREKGAKLIFDGNMHYRLSGPTTFDGIVFDTVGNPATNLIAARYNPLVFGEDCKMLKTIRDNYQLWVVGGYQYFRYTDFIGVKIDDPYLEMVTPARPIAWDSVPADLTQFSYVAGSGKTHTPSLQKDAAAAFEAMFKDMKAEGLYLPYCGWNFRSAHTQYGIFSDQLGDRRVKGQDFATAYHGVEVSCSIPGSSEHQLGFAFDIYDERLEELYPGNAHGHYDKTSEWQWIIDNGHKYGIIHRFMKAKTAVTGFVYEAWHFRYVGVEHATAIAQTDYCLEEYVAETMGMFAKDSSVTVLSGDFYQIMGGSRGCDYLTFTGTNRVTVGEGATVVNLVDVDEEVITEGFGEPTCIGDANGDAVVSLTDVIRVLKACTDGSVALDKANADMNKDATIDIRDALLILKACLNG